MTSSMPEREKNGKGTVWPKERERKAFKKFANRKKGAKRENGKGLGRAERPE